MKEHLCLKNYSSNLSSHDVIIGALKLPIPTEETPAKDYSSSYTPFIVKKPKWNQSGMEGYQAQTERILQELTDSYDKLEFIPTLCEMFAKALVISAENNFETVTPKEKKKKNLPYFSPEYRAAHTNHKSVCSEWRRAGRPSDRLHPAKAAVLQSRRNVQHIGRIEEASKAIKNHDELMEAYDTDINKVYSKLKKYRGEDSHRNDIPFIETLAGKYVGNNVL